MCARTDFFAKGMKVGADGYTFFDVRKAADYAEGHIPGAVSADMDAAKEGDFNAGVSTMQVATRDMDDTLVPVSYTHLDVYKRQALGRVEPRSRGSS